METKQSDLLFFKEFLRHPSEVAALLPTSDGLIEDLLHGFQFDDARVIVEYGAGTGVVTHQICSRMSKDSTCIAVEPNNAFHDKLEHEGSQVRVIQDYAENVSETILRDYGAVDLIVSGLPCSLMPMETLCKIVEDSHELLRKHGELRLFFYAHSLVFPKVQKMMDLLRSRFSRSSVAVSWRNFPPMAIAEFVK